MQINDPAFINDCRRQLEGKLIIIIRSGDQKVKISYKDYVEDQYGLRFDTLCTCARFDKYI